MPITKLLSPTQEDLQEALRAVQRAKALVIELSDNSDYNSVKERLLDVSNLLIERHSANPIAIQEIRGNLRSAAKLDASTALRSELQEFLELDLQMED